MLNSGKQFLQVFVSPLNSLILHVTGKCTVKWYIRGHGTGGWGWYSGISFHMQLALLTAGEYTVIRISL